MDILEQGRSIRRYEAVGISATEINLSDLIMVMAANVEDAYLKAGISEFTAQDCFDKGFELAKAMLAKPGEKRIVYRCTWRGAGSKFQNIDADASDPGSIGERANFPRDRY